MGRAHSSQSMFRETMDLATARALVAGLDVGILVVDAQDRVLYRNAKAAALVPAAPRIQEVFADFAFTETFPGWNAALERVRDKGDSLSFRCTGQDGESGERSALRVRCLPGDEVAFAGEPTVLIIVDTMEADAARQNASEMERQLSALDALLARIAHELNNPLDAVLRYINLALQSPEGAMKPRIKDYLTQSRVGAVRMMHMISDMLNHARGAETDESPRELDAVVREAVETHADAAERTGVAVTMALRSDDVVTGHGNRLFQVVSNLVRNAIDAMPEGGQLSISSRIDADAAAITIADTGTGLPADARRLFEPFFTTKPLGRGTGLGLAICKEFVEQRGGTIEALPRPDGGSVFVVRWPLNDRTDAPDQTRDESGG